ncbi:uncharacterized protein LOC102699300 [Oryza brachyantha]|nr:uncharacterized protein LOC102699300 [Oryza brachyantha]
MKASMVAVLVMMEMLIMSVIVYADDASSHVVMDEEITVVANSHGKNEGSVSKDGIAPGRKLISEATNTDSSTAGVSSTSSDAGNAGTSSAGASGTSSAGAGGTGIDSNYYVTIKGYKDYMKKFGHNP